jgi:hypothetical protein
VDESGVSPVDIIPPRFSILTLVHLVDEQLARWWPQFMEVVSPIDIVIIIINSITT